MRSCAFAVAFAVLFVWVPAAHAFVGVFAGRGDGAPESPATTVVLMRGGDQVVVSVRAEYRGPADDFAWVLPVPASVESDGVRTLRMDAFERIERLDAPRLVQLRERDPCATGATSRLGRFPSVGPGRTDVEGLPPSPEARFGPDAYGVAIVAGDAADLGRWLRRRGYRPPAGLEAAVRPYVEAGYRFLVARVDASRLSFADGRAALAPLRFHFRSDEVVLPVRLAAGGDEPHDLVVHVLAPERMESANRDDVLVPTNLVALPPARERIGEVYATILDRVFRRHPDAVVTEYAWNAGQCDPCPTRPLGAADLATFGADVIEGVAQDDLVLTRLHVWLDRPQASDLTLEEGPPIAGGRGRPRDGNRMHEGIDRRAQDNAFQARYAVLRPWRDAPSCEAPVDGRWGPPRAGRRIITAPAVTTIIPTGRLRRYLHSWAPVLRIPVRGDAVRTRRPSDAPPHRARPRNGAPP